MDKILPELEPGLDFTLELYSSADKKLKLVLDASPTAQNRAPQNYDMLIIRYPEGSAAAKEQVKVSSKDGELSSNFTFRQEERIGIWIFAGISAV